MVSIFSSHFFNWVKQLEGAGHEVYWLDVKDSRNKVGEIGFVKQIVGWRYRINYPGRYRIKSSAPVINTMINLVNERKLSKVFEDLLQEIQPDVVHSFVMYLSTVPILEVMKKNPNIKWIYSSWGSDIFYYGKLNKERREMKEVFPYLDYMFSDCKRDYHLAKNYGFNGKFLGVYPGRGGFDLNVAEKYTKPFSERKTILIKGYQGKHGKCIQVLKAILGLKEKLDKYKIAVFGADDEVRSFIASAKLFNWSNFRSYERIEHSKVLELMGKSFLFIGNSSSDGIPNTLLEAIVMGTFPLQSNPGGATGELIEDGKNGLLIQDPVSPEDIAQTILRALSDPELIRKGVIYNDRHIRPSLEREKVRDQVLEKYRGIEREIMNG